MKKEIPEKCVNCKHFMQHYLYVSNVSGYLKINTGNCILQKNWSRRLDVDCTCDSYLQKDFKALKLNHKIKTVMLLESVNKGLEVLNSHLNNYKN